MITDDNYVKDDYTIIRGKEFDTCANIDNTRGTTDIKQNLLRYL